MRGSRSRILCTLFPVFLLVPATPLGAREAASLLIVHDGENDGYARIYSRFQTEARLQGLTLTEYRLDLSLRDPTDLPAAVARHQPAVILAFGTRASRLADALADGVPVVAVDDRGRRAWTPSPGTILVDGFDPRAELALIARIMPRVQRVGIVYREGVHGGHMVNLRAAAAERGLEIVAEAVDDLRDFPVAMSRVLEDTCVLWCLPDTGLYNHKTARALILASFRLRIPLIAPSATWVAAGALMSIERDEATLGSRCAERIADVVTRRASQVVPRDIAFTLNLKTVRLMETVISETATTEAVEVFQ